MTIRGTMVALAVAALAAVGGYWFGQRGAVTGAHDPQVGAGETAIAAKKPLYYRNPMGLPDTSPTPKKDSMGMDYLAVYEGDAGAATDEPGTVTISPAKVQKLGVRTAVVERRALSTNVRGVGRVEIDERRLATVAPRFEGWIERLHVGATGQAVRKGQPLFDVYSPELISAQREYEVAAQGLARLKDAAPDAREGMQAVADAALARLKNWELSPAQLADIAAGKRVASLSVAAPASGIVLEKKAVQGMRFMPGEVLYQIADISSVWVIVDVFERDLAGVRVGQAASITLNAYPDQRLTGTVDFIYPTLTAATRTVPVRVVLANPGGLLRPSMYANVELSQVGAGKTAMPPLLPLLVPTSAVLDSGTRQTVLLVKGEGRYAPRAVKLGRRSDDVVEVLDGLNEGDTVVTAANFLIDSESQLKAALGSMGEAGESPETEPHAGSH
ncbi:MAG: efflux RND transporter periplasmic adaptor subunit [Rhodocyclaceae bacterium]|jgi:Cu(I)/Ag(I) efflux system membrane fusion protein|nr:efflux RND transporter periplasmic adaptor subunit [Rhodocyclaceae bacterium]